MNVISQINGLLTSAISLTSDIVLITNNAGHIIYVNSAFEKTTGYLFSEIEGKTPRILKSGKHDLMYYQKMWKTFTDGNTFRGITFNKKKSGEIYCEEKTVTPIKNEKGEITHYVSMAKDITQRAQLEEKLRSKNNELNLFIHRTQHDLKSPLNQLSALLSLSKSEYEYKKLIEYIDLMEVSVAHAQNILKDLSEIAKYDQKNLMIEKIEFETIIDNLLQGFTLLPKYESIKIVTDISHLHDFYSDKYSIIAILQNLIHNAINYHDILSSDKIPFIIITTNDYKNGVRITIEDNGLGIENNYLDKIFDMYFRVQSDDKGTGLGLYIVKKMIDFLSGKIEVASQIGKGTMFTIVLPQK